MQKAVDELLVHIDAHGALLICKRDQYLHDSAVSFGSVCAQGEGSSTLAHQTRRIGHHSDDLLSTMQGGQSQGER